MAAKQPFTYGLKDPATASFPEGLVPNPETAAEKVIVIGAGISGLSSAILLQEAGYDVSIWAKATSPHTTSDVAGAAWYPYRAAGNRLNSISKTTRQALEYQHRRFDPQQTGITSSEIVDLRRHETPDPPWMEAADGLRHAWPHELPPGYEDGFIFRAPVIDMTRYLSFLMSAFTGRGGLIEVREVKDLADAFEQANVVVNCTGLGSRELIGDSDIHAAKGQVVKIKPRPLQRNRVLIDESRGRLTYVIPRIADIVLGGTFEEYNDDPAISQAHTRNIIRRTTRLDSGVTGVKADDILTTAVGFRPLRSSVKLEAERPTPDTLLVHNIGHGGSGVTLSWGCAAEVTKLVNAMTESH